MTALVADQPYRKAAGFEHFHSRTQGNVDHQRERVLQSLRTADAPAMAEVLASARRSLEQRDRAFDISQLVADELEHLIEDAVLPRYIYHRYRYDAFPRLRRLDDHPPYVQIEPTSLCNYRCTFCFQRDTEFFAKANPAMGAMSFERFRDLVDQIEGHVEFVSLDARGEPLLNPELPRLLEYTTGKFLGLKLNTNTSLLTEAAAHAVLASGITTLVFSADAATEPLYSRLRVNGRLDRVLRNIDRFQEIKAKHYPKRRLLTRVSGVYVSSREQDFDAMRAAYAERVDQVVFVPYNAWENIYELPPGRFEAPCSYLWRTMEVLHDGTVSACQNDYRATLGLGRIGTGSSVSDVWRGSAYAELRAVHAAGRRQSVEPCRRCGVV